MSYCGYLVVLSKRVEPQPTNPGYCGIDRLPYYPAELTTEKRGIERYFLSNLRDDEGFLKSLEDACYLFEELSSSPRKFEILHCCLFAEFTEIPKNPQSLGFDVASRGGEFWSIVADFPTDETFKDIHQKLNRYGLFDNLSDAFKYLDLYRMQRCADWDMNFGIYSVERIQTHRNAT
jgi:hypothetical protein